MYGAGTPNELWGHYPGLIEPTLGGAEPEYLLYSTIRETSRGPFGLKGPQGSHAVALTKTSLILSRDSHQPGARRSMRRIPLTHVLTLGSAKH